MKRVLGYLGYAGFFVGMCLMFGGGAALDAGGTGFTLIVSGFWAAIIGLAISGKFLD